MAVVSSAASDDSLRLSQRALSRDWTIERRASVLNRADGRIAFRFHPRDVHLVMRQRERGTSVPLRVLVDGEPPSDDYGLDVDEQGHGTLVQPQFCQLIRLRGLITDRTFEITFLAPASRPTCSHSARPPTPLRRQTDTSSRNSRTG